MDEGYRAIDHRVPVLFSLLLDHDLHDRRRAWDIGLGVFEGGCGPLVASPRIGELIADRPSTKNTHRFS
jgi:hypothetical protein